MPKQRQNLKLELIAYLLKQGGQLDDILSLSKKALTSEGLKLGKKTITLGEEQIKVLGQYVKRNKEKISEYLFPSLKGGQLSKQNFLLGFRKWTKQRGENLADYGIVSTRTRKPKVQLDNMQAILDFLK